MNNLNGQQFSGGTPLDHVYNLAQKAPVSHYRISPHRGHTEVRGPSGSVGTYNNDTGAHITGAKLHRNP